jgi:hypothetical protein
LMVDGTVGLARSFQCETHESNFEEWMFIFSQLSTNSYQL